MQIRWHWSSWKRSLRVGGVLGSVFGAGVVLTIFRWPLWIWLTVEAVQRYLPLWLQIVFLTVLGWQLDSVFHWDLGTGVAWVLVIQASVFLVRLPRTPLLQLLARTLGFLLFALVVQRWWLPVPEWWLVGQVLLYSVAVLLNYYRSNRV